MKNLSYKIILLLGFTFVTANLNAQESRPAAPKDSILLKPIVVKGAKYGRFSDYSAQTLQMSTFDIITNPAAMADIIGNMRILPGVQANDNDGRLIIQGGGTDESQIYINDLIVVNPYRFSAKNTGTRTRFNSDLFEGIVLQSGGFNAEFGQALSGIINLNTKEKEQMEARTDLSLSSVYAGVSHTDQKPSYAYRVSLDYTNLAPYRQLVSDGYDWKKHYQQMAFDFFLTKAFSPRTKMTAQLNVSPAGGEYASENVDSVRMTNDFRQSYLYAQLNVYHIFNKKLSLSAAGNVVIDQLSGTDALYPNDRLKTQNLWNHNKITLQYKSGKWINRTGAELMANPYRETYFLDREYVNAVHNSLASVYNDTKLFLTNHLTASVGLRGEYSVYLKRFNLAPRLYIGYRLQRKHIVSASFGEYFQLPVMDYLMQSDAVDFVSVDKGTVSYSYIPKNNSKLQVDAYYKKYKNVVTYRDGQPVAIDNDGNGQGYGADVFLKNNFKQLEYWLSYSYNQTKKRYDGFPEAVAPDYVARHSFNATLKYWLAPLKSLVSANYAISSGTPYYDASYSSNPLGRTPFHNSLSVSWSYVPNPGLVIHFACQNVFGYRNIYGYEYSSVYPGVRREIANSSTRFLLLGVFLTLSNNKQLNQLKNL
ncbi:MAG: hypothetical protein LBB85_00055 [Dysgonamonadaceae bacterium]|jgi:hypothetical protein|nr:hypothetical protein [Dysgonamonadaceae bacterium]